MVAVQNSSPFPVSIVSSGGVQVNFPVNTSFEPYRREAFRHRTIASQRQSINLTNITGEGTVNTEGLWRREQTEWSMGAGQYSLDRKGDSQETRFLSSKGVDVFSYPLQATLLPDTYRLDSGTVGANLLMSRCGDYVVTANGATVTYYNSTWTPTTCTVGSAYGGSAWSVVNSITTNDAYAFIATDTGIWFCQIGVSSVFQLYAAPDLTTNFTGGFTMVRWANDQLIASYNNRLYAILPRDGSATAPFGSAPSTGTGTTNIETILGGGSFLSTPGMAQVTTQSPHSLTTGQKVTITGTQMDGDITGLSLTSGYLKCTTALEHGLVTGQTGTVSLTYTTGKVITESFTVTSVQDNTHFTFKTSKVLTITHFTWGQFLSSEDNYGFNGPYNVTVTPPSSSVVTTVAPSTPSTGYVTYTINSVGITGPGVGDTMVVTGSGVAGFNGTFVVTAQGGSSGAWTFTVQNSTTGVSTGIVDAIMLSRVFEIDVPRTNGASATGGSVSTPVSADVLYTHENPNYIWTDATDGETQIYFGGCVQSPSGKRYSGCIYRSDLPGSSTSNATQTSVISATAVAQPWELNTPVQALPMSPDEYPTCVKSYLNYIFVGTNRGIRMCQTLSIYDPTATATGDLKSGPLEPNILQPVTLPVTAIVGDGRFVWFAWNNYDTASTGLGKLDLSTYIAGDPLAPAYASDIMVTGQGVINSLDWNPNTNTPMMAVASKGIYGPYATNSGGNMVVSRYVPSGTITSGIFDYGISDPKVPVYFDYDALTPGATSVTATDSVDGGASTSATSGTYQVNQGYPVTMTRGRQFSVTVTLNAATTTTTDDTSPTLNRWVLKSWPCVVSGTNIMLVIQNFDVNLEDGGEYFNDPYESFVWLEGLRLIQDFVTYTEGPMSVVCTIDGMDLLPHKMRDSTVAGPSGGYESDLVVTLKTQGNYVYTPFETTT
jgi:hypothetical protein